jgi:hypothetical protein
MSKSSGNAAKPHRSRRSPATPRVGVPVVVNELEAAPHQFFSPAKYIWPPYGGDPRSVASLRSLTSESCHPNLQLQDRLVRISGGRPGSCGGARGRSR